MSPTKAFALALAALYGAATFQPVFAQDRNSDGYRDIMTEEGGRPLKKNKAGEPQKKATQPKVRPRGSSYIPPTELPRTGPIIVTPSPGVYVPPPVNSFSDRVINCNHSFPLNAGIGNNPTDRNSYVRQCAN